MKINICPVAGGRARSTLLEVMIAVAIFFMAAFAILGLVSSSLANARRLQRPPVDASPVLAHYAATNSLVEGTYSGNLVGYCSAMPIAITTGRRHIDEVATNNLFSVGASSRPAAAAKSFRT